MPTGDTELDRMVVRLMGDGSQYTKTLDDAVKHTDKSAKTIEKSASSIANTAAVIGGLVDAGASAGLEALGSLIEKFQEIRQECVNAFIEEEKSFEGLHNILEANGRDVESLSSDYNTFTKYISSISTSSQNSVRSLLQFAEAENLTGAAAERAAKNALTLQAAHIAVGHRALMMAAQLEQGNTTMIAHRLGLSGIADEAERAAAVQERLDKEFALVEKSGETLGGKQERLKNSIEEVEAGFGELIVRGLDPFVVAGNDVIGGLKELAEQNNTTVSGFIASTPGISEAITVWQGIVYVWKSALSPLTALNEERNRGLKLDQQLIELHAKQNPQEVAQDAKVQEDFTKHLEGLKKQQALLGVKGAAASVARMDTSKMTDDQVAQLSLEAELLDTKTAAVKQEEELTKAHEHAVKSIENQIEAVREQNATFGMSKDQLIAYKATVDGVYLSESQLANLKKDSKALEDKKEAKKAAEEVEKHKKHLMDQGKSVTKQFGTDAEKLAEKQKELNELLEAGAISGETYTKAMNEATKALHKHHEEHKGNKVSEFGTAEDMAKLSEYRSGLVRKDALGGGSSNVPIGVGGPVAVASSPVAQQGFRVRADHVAPIFSEIATGIQQLVLLATEEMAKPQIEITEGAGVGGGLF